MKEREREGGEIKKDSKSLSSKELKTHDWRYGAYRL
jgi:hypothetical protein